MMQTDDVNKKRCPPWLHSSGRTHVPIHAKACLCEHKLQKVKAHLKTFYGVLQSYGCFVHMYSASYLRFFGKPVFRVLRVGSS